MSALAALAIYWAGGIEPLEDRLSDIQVRWLRSVETIPSRTDIEIVVFDDKFLEAANEPFALFHVNLARVLNALEIATPSLVALDIALPEKSSYSVVPRDRPDFDYDRELLKALTSATKVFPVLLSRTVDSSGRKLRQLHAPLLAVAERSPKLVKGLSASSSAMLCLDRDTTVRRFPSRECTGINDVPPLASAMAASLGKSQPWEGRIDFSIGQKIKTHLASDVIAAALRGDDAWLRSQFAGRPVLVGAIFKDEDEHLLPVTLNSDATTGRYTPGVMIHAQIFRSLMTQGLIDEAPKAIVSAATFIGCFAFFGLTSSRKVLLSLVVAGALVAIATFSYSRLWYVPLTPILMAILISLASRATLDSFRAWQERRRLRDTFGGSVSPVVMSRLESGEIAPAKLGAKADIVVLFCDVRGFTTLSEQLPPEEVVLLLNAYLGGMTSAIHRNGGVVDKFLGDGLMAFFGQPEVLSNASQSALDAAREMLTALGQLNANEFKLKGVTLTIGIGIHRGSAVVGFIGSSQRHEFTAIGDTVNTASRLEGLTKSLGYPIVCSEIVASSVKNPPYLIDLGEQKIKGRAAVNVYGWQPE